MKNTAYNVDYSRSNLASTITWLDSKNKIENFEPFIQYIRCDDGDEYQFINSNEGDIVNESLFMFEAIKVKGTEADYLLCYSADFEIVDIQSKIAFANALKKSKNQIEIVIGLKTLKVTYWKMHLKNVKTEQQSSISPNHCNFC